MAWILVAIAVLIAIIAFVIKQDISHPVFIFEIEWAFILALYQLNLFGFDYFEISLEAFVLLFFQLVMFPIGFFCFQKIRLKVSKIDFYPERKETALLHKCFFVLCGISAAILFGNDLIIIRNLLQGNSFIDIARQGIATSEINGITAYLMIFIVYPTVAISSPVCATEFFKGSKRKWQFFFANILLVGLSVLDHGGRVYLINMFVCYVLSYIICGEKVKLTKKQKRFIYVLIAAIFLIVIALSVSRGIEDIGESFYLYLSCSVPHMVSRMDQPLFADNRSYGFLSLRGFTVPIHLVLSFLGLLSGEPKGFTLAERFSIAIEQNAIIGTNVRTNAFLPAVYYFYLDFGMIGAIIGMFIYGVIIGKSYRKAKSTLSKKYIAIFLYLMYGLVSSYIRFPFKTYQYALGFILINLIYRKEQGQYESEE